MSQVNLSFNPQLSEREIALLQRLLSDPERLPQEFKVWLVRYLELSDMNLPISAINGLRAQLNAIGSTAGGSQNVIGARGPYTTNATGYFNVILPASYSAIEAIVVTSMGAPGVSPPASNIATCTYNVVGVGLNNFDVLVWDVNLNAPYVSKPVYVSWIAHVTP